MHRKVLPELLIAARVLHHDADAGAMQVDRQRVVGLVAHEAADGQVLSDLLHERLALRLDILAGDGEQRERRDVGRVPGGHDFGDRSGELLEVLVLRNEVGLTVHFRYHAHLAARADKGADHPFSGHTGGLLCGGGKALLSEDIYRLFKIAAGLLKRLFGVHHAGAGLFSQVLYCIRRYCCHDEKLPSLSFLCNRCVFHVFLYARVYVLHGGFGRFRSGRGSLCGRCGFCRRCIGFLHDGLPPFDHRVGDL